MYSLVIPAHNESKNLAKSVSVATLELSKLGEPFEIIVAEDGSTDDSFEIAKKIASLNSHVVIFHSDVKLGRGKALKQAFSKAKGTTVAYMDADVATNPKHLKTLFEYAKLFDVVTGSRYLPDSEADRTKKRIFLSSGYNLLVRLLTGSKVYDHQCGFKAFQKSVILTLDEKSVEDKWSWDTEVLVLAQRLGYSVKEFPVEWKEQKQTTVNLKRDVLDMAASVFRLSYRLLFNKV